MNRVEKMFHLASEVKQRSYSPYSKFKVGCALLADDGQYYVGTNVENAAYPSTQCAEASAIGTMIASGGQRICELLIMGTGNVACFPCGNCLQKISEFAQDDCKVHVVSNDTDIKTYDVTQLMPFQFTLLDDGDCGGECQCDGD